MGRRYSGQNASGGEGGQEPSTADEGHCPQAEHRESPCSSMKRKTCHTASGAAWPQWCVGAGPRSRVGPTPGHVTALVLLTLLPSLFLSEVTAQSGTMNSSETSTATYYGGNFGEGTMGGACGYGNLYNTGYGQMNAAASIAMWDEGRICGSCYEVTCVSSNIDVCIKGAKVVVTVTNQCPQGSEGGWCDRPHRHLDMSMPAWLKIASNPKAGVLTTSMRRVPCTRSGGVAFQISGNPHWTQVMVFNVAGSGDLDNLSVSRDGGSTWIPLKRNWGSVWSVGGDLLGRPLSFKLQSYSIDESLILKDVIPSNWYLGGTYRTDQNFKGASGAISNGGGTQTGNATFSGKTPKVKKNPGKSGPAPKGRKPVKDNHIPMSQRWWRKKGKIAHA